MKLSKILILIFIFTIFIHLFRIDYPNSYIFDEVYHAFTAKEYLINNRDAWNPWATPPKGVAYEWTHPPLAKEIMTLSMALVNSTDAWAYRLPGALLGILSVYLVYLIGLRLLNSQIPALIAAFIYSLEGLALVQSRTGMNDIYFLTFMLASFLFFVKKKFLFSSIFFGLSLASKWTIIYLLGFYLILLFKNRELKKLIFFVIIPPVIYLLTYVPYFLLGYDLNQFIELQKQMWGYHTNLRATHDYASPWWSWPLNLYPVWYHVEYMQDKIANIFASGNPAIFWAGTAAIILTIIDIVRAKSRIYLKSLLIILSGFFIFWLPWAVSPRIMFLYHFSPSVPFLSIALGYQVGKLWESKNNRLLAILLLILMFIGFLLVYPFLTGIPIPKEWVKYFFMTNITKNPFGQI